MCGGSAPSQVQKTEWNDELGPRFVSTFTRAERESEKPYQPYTGARFAPLSNNQNRAINNMDQFTTGLNSPTGAMNAGLSQIEQTARGDHLGSNPAGQFSGEGNDPFNPWTHQFRNNYANQGNAFGGMSSPYFNDMLKTGMDDITNAYKQGTSADTTRMFNLSGAFGGSAHQNAVANNENALGKQLGNYAQQMQNSQYDRSAGLEESRIGRGFQSDESMLARGNEGWQRAADRTFQGHEGERGRQMQAIGLGQNENQNVLARIQGLMQTGGLAQNQTQQQYDFNFDQYNQAQNSGWNQIRNLMDVYARSMGAGAGVNTSVYGGGGSGVSQGLGGLLAAYAMMGK